MATQEQRERARSIIHGAAVAAGGTSAVFGAGIPGAVVLDTPILCTIYIQMTRALAEIFDRSISDDAAIAMLAALVGFGAGVLGVQVLLSAFPGLGNIANASISAACMEGIGWWVFEQFDRETKSKKS